jgi:competence protein ComEC
VRATCEELARRGVPIRFVWSGDRLPVDSRVGIEFLHPAADSRLTPDNANSLVLSVEFGGRTILLTGDLEAAGLDALLAKSPRHADVLLAPHHGSRGANTRPLAEWARPGWVIVSGGRHDLDARLHEIYGPESRLLSTHDCGAITFVIDAHGGIRCETFRGCGE